MIEIIFHDEGPHGSFFEDSCYLGFRPHIELPSDFADQLFEYLENHKIKATCHKQEGNEKAFIELPYATDPKNYLTFELTVDLWLAGLKIDRLKVRTTTWFIEEDESLKFKN